MVVCALVVDVCHALCADPLFLNHTRTHTHPHPSGRRLIHECVQAGLYAIYDSQYEFSSTVAEEGRVLGEQGPLDPQLGNPCRFFELFG